MDRNAYSDSGGEVGQPDAYWRRRAITLALGLGLLGILAWGFSGGGGKPTPSGTSGVLPVAALGTAIPGLTTATPSSSASPVSASVSASGGSGSPSAGAGTASADPSNPAISPSGTLSPSAPRPEVSGGSGAAASSGGGCIQGSVVLSLFTDRSSYGRSQYPRFALYAVSTSAGSCAFDPGQLQVVVLSAGRIVWDSADCDHGNSRVAELTRGVPAQEVVVWNRKFTLPGCQVLVPSARLGTYTVQARTTTVESPVRTFKLVG